MTESSYDPRLCICSVKLSDFHIWDEPRTAQRERIKLTGVPYISCYNFDLYWIIIALCGADRYLSEMAARSRPPKGRDEI